MNEAAVMRLAPNDLAAGRPYLERQEQQVQWWDDLSLALWYGVGWPVWRRLGGASGARALVDLTHRLTDEVAALDDDALRMQARALRGELRRTGFGPAPVARCFALVREAAGRVLGKRHYNSQLHAGWLLLRGTLVEMATGEGKTFAATLPACTAALAGVPVHVITVNDYLAARDAESMKALYAFFGLRCAAVVHGMTRPQRRQAYACDVAYASNKEVVFDYLRDRSALGERSSTLHRALAAAGIGAPLGGEGTVLRGLCFAVVDEADSVFIDEARTPLILSASLDRGGAADLAGWALQRARRLEEGRDYKLERHLMRVRLTDAARDALERELDGEPVAGDIAPVPPDLGAREAAEKLTQALSALLLYERDQQYVVADGKVQIVDESTGRVMPDRSWERGLHQMIEVKEGVELTGERATIARITYQRFFARYLRLGGMTGTATEVATEIGTVYRLPVARVPLHRPRRWTNLGERCLPTAAAKWDAVVDAVKRIGGPGRRPVLIGTRTVRSSEELSARLAEAGIEHVVLNAKQDGDEAEVVSRAGRAGAVTVATNMAGRGTDIPLGEDAAGLGGLHVILTEYHESPRIDRQLFGRASRQGDPGSGEALVSLEDELFRVHAAPLVRLLKPLAAATGRLPHPALVVLRAVAQRSASARGRRVRMASLKQDRRLAGMLAFSGRGE